MQDDYSSVLIRVFNKVQDRKEGVLFACIELMDKKKSKEIVEHFSINPSASFYEDSQVLAQTSSFRPVLKKIDPMNIRNMPLIGWAKKPMDWNPSLSVGVIVVLALVIVGLWSLQQSDDMRNIFGSRKEEPNRKDRSQQVGGIRVDNFRAEDHQSDLYLVVPCNRIKSSLQSCLQLNTSLPFDQAITLVDDSVYFLAEKSEVNSISRIALSDGWNSFPEDSDLLIQLRISEEKELVGIDLKRSLSRAISEKSKITIKKIGLLNGRSNLQGFHRA